MDRSSEEHNELKWERYLELKIPESTNDIEGFVKEFDELAKKHNVGKIALVHRAVYRDTEGSGLK